MSVEVLKNRQMPGQRKDISARRLKYVTLVVKNLFTIDVEGHSWSNTLYKLQPFSHKV